MAPTAAAQVSEYLTQGGDERIRLDKQGMNKYYVKPQVQDPSTIHRAFCTCSPPSAEGHEACCKLLRRLRASPQGQVEVEMEKIRLNLKTQLGLGDTDELIFHPSGTDAEYLPLLYAMQRRRALNQGDRIVNVLAAGGEVGSQTSMAAGGMHFSNMGGQSCVGQPLKGFEDLMVSVIEVAPRGRNGRLLHDYDDQYQAAVDNAEAQYPEAFFIIHAALSKTGLLIPSHATVEAILSRLNGRVLLVLDACQLRISGDELKWYLQRNAMILITGSKFFGGPGFCGAVVCPCAVAQEFASNPLVPSGLSLYLSKAEVPATLPALRQGLDNPEPNIGLMMRWLCALTEMEAFNADQKTYTARIPQWVAAVRKEVEKCEQYLELLADDQAGDHGGHLGGCNTTLCVRMHVPGSGEPTLQDLKDVQLLLLKDLSDQMPSSASADDREAVRRCCMIGQPVWMGSFGVLRISLGAPITRHWKCQEDFDSSLQDDVYLLRKWVLIIKYFKESASGHCHLDELHKLLESQTVAVQ